MLRNRYDLRFFLMADDDFPETMRFHPFPSTFLYAKDGSLVVEHAEAAEWSAASVMRFLRSCVTISRTRYNSRMSHLINCDPLKELIRTVPDFPKPGILFYDITTLLKDKAGFAQMIDAFAAYYIDKQVDLVLGIEARGFIFGPAMAYRLNAGFVPVRKPKKLPAATARVTYDLEYGSDSLEIHLDAIQPGQRVVIVDDLLATGGTMQATVQLVRQLGGEIAGVAFAVELDFLKGRQKFPEIDVYSLLHYNE